MRTSKPSMLFLAWLKRSSRGPSSMRTGSASVLGRFLLEGGSWGTSAGEKAFMMQESRCSQRRRGSQAINFAYCKLHCTLFPTQNLIHSADEVCNTGHVRGFAPTAVLRVDLPPGRLPRPFCRVAGSW